MLDVTMTPDSELMVFSKGTWLLIVGAFWVFGAAAWLAAGRPRRLGFRRMSSPYRGGYSPADALMRHPAAQAASGYGELAGAVDFMTTPRPLGPDDDPDFLLELDRRIREARDDALSGRLRRLSHPGVGVQAGDEQVDADHVEHQAHEAG
jgi:hypothetical protein